MGGRGWSKCSIHFVQDCNCRVAVKFLLSCFLTYRVLETVSCFTIRQKRRNTTNSCPEDTTSRKDEGIKYVNISSHIHVPISTLLLVRWPSLQWISLFKATMRGCLAVDIIVKVLYLCFPPLPPPPSPTHTPTVTTQRKQVGTWGQGLGGGEGELELLGISR